jgi:cAMP phosphodiesterase
MPSINYYDIVNDDGTVTTHFNIDGHVLDTNLNNKLCTMVKIINNIKSIAILSMVMIHIEDLSIFIKSFGVDKLVLNNCSFIDYKGNINDIKLETLIMTNTEVSGVNIMSLLSSFKKI